MDWFVMAAGVPEGTQILAVSAPTQGDAVRHAISEIRKAYNLPKSHTIMPRILERCDSESEAQRFIDRLNAVIKEEEKNAQA